jgi:oligo-alginate lyase
MWDAPLSLAFPDGSPPGFNDNNGGNIATYFPLYELAYARWKKPEYGRVAAKSARDSLPSLLWGAESVEPGPMVPQRSSLLRSGGFAMLRAPEAWAAIRFGMHGGGHGHPDKLNLVTWGAGKAWGLDPGSINYGVPLHGEWYRSTIAHNTVAVDQRNQANPDGKLEEWKEAGGSTTIAASVEKAYPGVRLARTVTARAGKLEDRFECTSDADHAWDWAFHSKGRLETSLKLEPGPERLGTANGYQHIEKVSARRSDGDWWARWEQDGARLTLRVKGGAGAEIFTGVAPGKDPADRVPVLVIRRRGRQAVFEVVHEFQAL